MSTTLGHTPAPLGTLKSSHVSADMDALADAGYAYGGGADKLINNSAGAYTHINIHITMGETALGPQGDAHATVTLLFSHDNSIFETPYNSAVAPPPGSRTYALPCSTTKEPKNGWINRIPIDQGYYYIMFGNQLGRALPTGGNAVDYKLCSWIWTT